MMYLICIVLGIFIGQEYSIYLPNIKILTIYLLNYLKEKSIDNNTTNINSKQIEKNMNDNNSNSMLQYIYKFFR